MRQALEDERPCVRVGGEQPRRDWQFMVSPSGEPQRRDLARIALRSVRPTHDLLDHYRCRGYVGLPHPRPRAAAESAQPPRSPELGAQGFAVGGGEAVVPAYRAHGPTLPGGSVPHLERQAR